MTVDWYNDLLYLHAAKWGLEIPDPKPLINDKTSPYPRATIIEQFRLPGDTPGRYTEISLVTLNGRYSFTVCYQWQTRGCGYLPFLKFCDPYPTRTEALDAALAELKNAKPPPEVQAWIRTLAEPQQLSLF
jgi:hypothetical protein